MGDIFGSFAMIVNIIAALLFYGGIMVVVLIMRKLAKDMDSIKRKLSDIEEILQVAPRPGGRS
ncbi:MAG: hypothetical protein ACM336_05300 [Acidobacteriota bacterium]